MKRMRIFKLPVQFKSCLALDIVLVKGLMEIKVNLLLWFSLLIILKLKHKNFEQFLERAIHSLVQLFHISRQGLNNLFITSWLPGCASGRNWKRNCHQDLNACFQTQNAGISVISEPLTCLIRIFPELFNGQNWPKPKTRAGNLKYIDTWVAVMANA